MKCQSYLNDVNLYIQVLFVFIVYRDLNLNFYIFEVLIKYYESLYC